MSVTELRQYTLKPGQRDTLIALFEREFVESQEELGMDLIGTFHDADDSDRFVWLRRFADMSSRPRALEAFYGGPRWKSHSAAANATMIDSDNVLLLRPAWSGADFAKPQGPAPRDSALPPGLFAADIFHLKTATDEALIDAVRETVLPRYQVHGAKVLAVQVTERSANNFPRLPVREGENVVLMFIQFADSSAEKALRERLDLPAAFAARLSKPVDQVRLQPTARSRLRG